MGLRYGFTGIIPECGPVGLQLAGVGQVLHQRNRAVNASSPCETEQVWILQGNFTAEEQKFEAETIAAVLLPRHQAMFTLNNEVSMFYCFSSVSQTPFTV